MKKVQNASKVLHSLQNSFRERIFNAIKEHPGITVMEIYSELRMEQSVASRHLAILRQAGIVRTRRERRKVHYFLNEVNIKMIGLMVEQIAGFYTPAVKQLAQVKTSARTR